MWSWVMGSVTDCRAMPYLVKLIAQYRPDVIVLQDASAKESRRSLRIKELTGQIAAMAKIHRIKIAWYSFEQVRRAYFADGLGTKHALAEILADRFPELADSIPPKRRPWMSEDSRMDIFDAVALPVVWVMKNDDRRSNEQ